MSYLVTLTATPNTHLEAMKWCVENCGRLWRTRSSTNTHYHVISDTASYWIEYVKINTVHHLYDNYQAIGIYAFYKKEDALKFKLGWC